MIRDSIQNIARYEHIHKDIKAALAFLQQENLQPGKYDISPECYIMLQEYTTNQADEILYETHHVYADLQLVLQGEEAQYYHKVEALECTKDYVPDIAFYADKNNAYLEKIVLQESDFVIYFPNEAHAPGHCVTQPKGTKKAVIKLQF